MALETFTLGCDHSVYASPGVVANHRATLQKETDAGCGHTVQTEGPILATRRVTSSLTFASEMPDAYFGITSFPGVSINLDNRDQALNFLLSEEAGGRLVRIRRFDEYTQELRDVFQGSIQGCDVGDDVTITAEVLDPDVFGTELPKNRVYSTASQPNNTTVWDLTVNFPEAPELNVPINKVFGRVRHVPFTAIKFDDANKTYDYLVAEDIVDVEDVERDFDGKFVPTLVQRGTAAGGTTMSVTLDSFDDRPSGFYTDLYIKIVDGPGLGDVRRIVSYDGGTKVATVDTPWTVPPNDDGFGGVSIRPSKYEIREFVVLPGTIYYGRTAVRFHIPQRANGIPKAIRGTVVRYEQVKKNLLGYTDTITWQPTNAVQPGTWRHTSGPPYFDNTPLTDVEGPDGLLSGHRVTLETGSRIEGVSTAATDGLTQSFTVSVWLRSDTPGAVIHLGIGSTGILGPSMAAGLTSTWRRYTLSAPYVFISDYMALLYLEAGTDTTFDFAYPQLEDAPVASYYEPVHALGQGMLWSFPNAIREILQNPISGLNLAVDEDSFESSNQQLDGLFMRCQGVLPDLTGRVMTAKEAIDEMLEVRGMALARDGSAWSLVVSQPKTPTITVGTGETPEDNIVRLGPVRHLPASQVVKLLRVEYGQSIKFDSGDVIFPFAMEYPVLERGQPVTRPLHFVRDSNTADRYLQFVGQTMKLRGKMLSLSVGQIGRFLAPGDVINIVAPRRQVENRLLWSENLSQWTVTAGSVADRSALDPEGKSVSGCKFTNQASVNQTVVVTPASRAGIVSIWLRSDTSATFAVTVEAISGTSKTSTFTVGQGWKKCSLTHWFANSDTGSVRVTVVLQTAGVVGYAWGAHLCFDYERTYVATHGTAAEPDLLWQVQRIEREGVAIHSLALVPYSDSIFGYTKGMFPVVSPFASDVDPHFDPPIAPAVTVPPDPPTATALAGVNQSDAGDTNSWAILSFIMPARNVTAVTVQRRKIGEQSWEDVATIGVDEVGFDQLVTVMTTGLVPGRQYEVRSIAENSAGLTSTSLLIKTFVARGDTTAPPVPTSVAAQQATGRSVEIVVELIDAGGSDYLPDDHAYTRLYRATTNNYASAVLIDRATKLVFHDQDVQYATTYYYWARFEDLTGNLSAETGPAQVTVSKIQGAGEVENISADTITTGTLQVGGTGAPGEIRFRDASGDSGVITSGSGSLDLYPGDFGADDLLVGYIKASGIEVAFKWNAIKLNASTLHFDPSMVDPNDIGAPAGKRIPIKVGAVTYYIRLFSS